MAALLASVEALDRTEVPPKAPSVAGVLAPKLRLCLVDSGVRKESWLALLSQALDCRGGLMEQAATVPSFAESLPVPRSTLVARWRTAC